MYLEIFSIHIYIYIYYSIIKINFYIKRFDRKTFGIKHFVIY